MTGTMFITGDADADQLLNTDGTAVLIGMLLDQQVPMEWAFTGPATLHARLGHLDATKIAAMDQEDFVAVCCAKPAIHRFPASMGRRIHDMCTALVERFGGRGEGVWAGVTSGDELYDRLRTLPGYGDEKARIFVAILGKRFERAPRGLARGGRQVRRRLAAAALPTSPTRCRSARFGSGRRPPRQPSVTSRIDRSADPQGAGMSDVTGGKATSAVPVGTVGTSSVADGGTAEPRTAGLRRLHCGR